MPSCSAACLPEWVAAFFVTSCAAVWRRSSGAAGYHFMNPLELAQARQRAYHLFGSLFLGGITADLLPILRAAPDLAQAAGDFDADEAAAEHYHLTAVSVFPYESIFRDPSGLLGGEVSERIAALYRRSGFDVLSDADHVGHELTFMAYLCAAEADAWAGGDDRAAALWQSREQAFLAAHLLAWLAPLVAAVEQSTSTFYARLAQHTLDLAADHLTGWPADPPLVAPFDSTALAGEETGLKEIARKILTPPYSGIFLSRDAISALARRHKLPRGFGDRTQLLTNLLRTAGQYDMATAVLADLVALCSSWSDCYAAQLEVHPTLRPWIQPWQERVERTAASLNTLAAQLPRD